VTAQARIPLSTQLRRRVAAHRHTALLASIVVAFTVRPLLGAGTVVSVAFSCAMIVLLLVAIYAISLDDLVGDRQHLLARRHRRHVIAWLLAVPAILERIVLTVRPEPRFGLVSAICWLIFLAYVTWIELRSVLEQRQVTGETISMAISVYLLLGITWGILYFAMFQVNPHALSFGNVPGPPPDAASALHAFPLFIYFSLSTISTIGFGDVTPISMPARYAAVAEGITGQLYLAILIARLVSMQISGAGKS
jgi:uncharacterized membrane protein YhaH (DUF805 family)